MPVIRKLSPKNVPAKKEMVAELEESSEASVPVNKESERKGSAVTKRVCYFHKSKIEPAYWDASGLRKFLNDRGRIYPRSRTGTCAKHQRVLSREIKRARHLALLPFTVGI